MNTSQSISPMNDPHRATDSEWYCLEARTCGNKSDVVAYSCILELRDRIKALEATHHAHVDLSHLSDAERERMLKSIANPGRFEALEAATEAQLNHPAKPDSSLVEQVTDALVDVEAIDEDDDDPTYKYTSDAIRNGEGVIHLQARAAIRVIASELRAQGFVYAADWLEQEAER